MKTFRKIISEVAHKAKSTDEQRFIDQHTVEIIQHPVALDSQFTGEIEKEKRLADYATGQDATSYDKAYSMKESEYETNEMLIRQCHFIQYAADEIIEYLEEGNQVEGWYQNKLAVIFDKMQSLYAYAEGEKKMQDDYDFESPYYESALSENYKPGNLKLDNNDTVKVSAQDAKLLNDLLKDLDNKNRKNFEEILMTDKSGFEEIIGFAREAL